MKMYKKWIFIAVMLLNFFEANATPVRFACAADDEP